MIPGPAVRCSRCGGLLETRDQIRLHNEEVARNGERVYPEPPPELADVLLSLPTLSLRRPVAHE